MAFIVAGESIVKMRTVNKDSISAKNNHEYWSALGVGAAAIVAQNQVLMTWAMDTYNQAMSEISNDGYLPLEIARGTRANTYHLFAAGALVSLASLGRVSMTRIGCIHTTRSTDSLFMTVSGQTCTS